MDELKLFEIEPITTESGPSPEEIQEVFDYWVSVMEKTRATKLTAPRRQKIKRALGWFPRERLFDAIDGCKASRFHMGHNDRGRVYNDIEMIVRTKERIEMLAGIIDRDRQAKAERLKNIKDALEGN